MTIKAEANKGTIFATIKQYMDCGATVEQAIEKAEGILRVQLPEHIKSLIYQEAMSRK